MESPARIKGMSIHLQDCQEFDCICHKCTIIQSLHAQTASRHADAMFLMQCLVFAVVVLL
jgi:hypothetical protein